MARSRFAYNPSRAMDRSVTATPASPRPRFAPPGDFVDDGGDPTRYSDMPPGAGSCDFDEPQQRRQHDLCPGNDFARASAGLEQPRHDDYDQQLMPPPPIPTMRRHAALSAPSSAPQSRTEAVRTGTFAQPQQHLPERTHPSSRTAYESGALVPSPSFPSISTRRVRERGKTNPACESSAAD